ncbi:hypothetical protein [Virgibacillus chiguensis]
MIREIKRMNKAMGIPEKIATIDKGVIPKIVERALKEANPL